MNVQPKDTSKGHFYVSLAKSGLRIVAAGFLASGWYFGAGLFFGIAEILGIVEEIV
jgi:hypothetical protein